jgi:hypothetical protein
VPDIHLVSVFIGPDGAGGNPLAVFLDGQAIPPGRRLAVTAELGYSETVFVDDLDEGRIAIFVPTSELPFAGHPTVGTAWLLHEIGRPVATLRVPAGPVPAWRDAQWTWVRARPSWVDFSVNPNFVQMATAAEVDALPGHTDQPVAVCLGVARRGRRPVEGALLSDLGRDRRGRGLRCSRGADGCGAWARAPDLPGRRLGGRRPAGTGWDRRDRRPVQPGRGPRIRRARA